MATYQTPNLDLIYADQGEDDWHIFMQANLEKLDFDFQGAISLDTSTKAVTVAIGTIMTGGSGADTLTTGSGEEFLAISGISEPALDELDVTTLLPVDCRIKNLRVYLPTPPGTGESRVFTLIVNGVASDLTCTVSGTTNFGSDTSNVIELGAGTRVCLMASVSGVAAASRVFFGMEVEQHGIDTGS